MAVKPTPWKIVRRWMIAIMTVSAVALIISIRLVPLPIGSLLVAATAAVVVALATHLADAAARSLVASAAGVAALQLSLGFYPAAIRRSESAILQCVAILGLLTCVAVLVIGRKHPDRLKDPSGTATPKER
jgi:hypothetical protein